MKLTQYIKGLRKGKDAHKIERDAMEDTFLADALEGFESVEGNHAERIERMQRRIALRSQDKHLTAAKIAAKKRSIYSEASEVMMDVSACAEMATEERADFTILKEHTTNKKKRRNIMAWAAAAVLLLFIATWGYFWLLKEDQASPQLAVVTESPVATKDATPITEDRAIHTASESNELMESYDEVLAQGYQENASRREQERSTSTTAAPVALPPSPVPAIEELEEKHILADAETAILDSFRYQLNFNAETDSVLNLNKPKLEDSTYLKLFASKDAEKSQPLSSISAIDADNIGIYSNTNRHALSQSQALSGKVAGIQVNEKKETEFDSHALTPSQLLSQGKVGGRLADQSQNSYLSKAEKRRIKQAAEASMSAPAPSSQIASGNITGRVIDRNGEPIPFVTVAVKGTTDGTTTDMEGYFALNAKNAEKVVASFVGFDTVELPVDTIKPMTIAMNESATQLEEMVVIAYGRNIADDSYSYRSVTTPEPEDGYSAYRKYLNESLRKPTDECADKKGRVVLTFYVNSNGRPYNIQVKRSLCPSADREAIRLIEEGGNWTTGDGEVRINVRF
ncbi:MAG: carboxypeptidase-like regulatory domain-containing protein [Prevotellaceae bacterium]|jgi:hypothetical protein|nr:carboxypeptidase-like regulatory domain-containing protein [Prevotellaceae bacterium]